MSKDAGFNEDFMGGFLLKCAGTSAGRWMYGCMDIWMCGCAGRP